jgi:hypothetical protein
MRPRGAALKDKERRTERLTALYQCGERQHFYGDLVSPATIKRGQEFM